MKLLIDSKPVKISVKENVKFQEYCQEIMNWLLARNRSIASCSLDGKTVGSLEEADEVFKKSNVCEVKSIPLTMAMHSALTLKEYKLKALEEDCETLVTDALLAEPEEIAQKWHEICDAIKEQLAFLPQLSGLLTEQQVDQLVDKQLVELNEIMHAINKAFNSADTVSISDIIEFQLLPWLRNSRDFMRTCIRLIETIQQNKD